MGDVILTSPVIEALRSTLPDARIDFVTSAPFSDAVICNPRLSNVYIYNKTYNNSELAKFRNILRQNEYDLVIDLHRNFRTRFLRYKLGKMILKIKKNRLKKLALVHLKINLYPPICSITDKYLDTVREFTVNSKVKDTELWLAEEAGQRQYPPENRTDMLNKLGTIAVAPGAHHFTKRYPAEKYAELIKRLIKMYNSKIILVGGENDRQICNEINTANFNKLLDFSGTTSITGTAALLDKCDLVITNDTGVMHIAAARRVPVVSIFGSSVREFGFSPSGENNIIIEKMLKCRPCSHIGRSKCPKGHFNCMNLITPEDIITGIRKLGENKI